MLKQSEMQKIDMDIFVTLRRFGRVIRHGLVAVLLLPLLFQNLAYGYEFKAKTAIVIDYKTKSVLVAKNPDQRVGPASMAKMMTLEVVFHALRNGSLKLDQEFPVSEHAWRTGGAPSRTSTMFAKLKSTIPVEDLIRGAAVQSANDACIVLAEGMAGSEAAFATMMNERAVAIGLRNSFFTNPTGLPDPDMYVTVADLARLAMHLIETYPEYYSYFGEAEFTWNKIRQYNKNPLARKDIGVDGLKTGFTEESGYGFAVTSNRNGQRVLAVLHGLESKKDRAAEAEKVLAWAYAAFLPRVLFETGDVIGEARVFGGTSAHVPLLGDGLISILVPNGIDERLRAKVVYEGPVRAPVKKGQQIGYIEIYRDEIRAQETPLYAGEDVPVGGMVRRAIDGAQELLFGYW